MRRRCPARFHGGGMIALLMMGLGLNVSGLQAEEKGAPVKKPMAQSVTAKPQTQTTPEAGKTPATSGIYSMTGSVEIVTPPRRSVVIRGTNNTIEVFLTTKSKVSRDGKDVDILAIRTKDRVDSCEFNGKHVVRTLVITSGEKLGIVALPESEVERPKPYIPPAQPQP